MKTRSILFLFLFVSMVYAQPQKIRVACVGNSITYGGLGNQSYPQQLGMLLGNHFEVRNFGVSGRTLLRNGDYPYWKEETFINAKEFLPHIVIISLGTNDSKPQNWIYKAQFYQDYIDFINEFRKSGRNPRIFVANPPPVFKDGFGITNSIIRDEIIPMLSEIRSATGTFLLDFNAPMLSMGSLFPDGIHPNAAGYLEMAKIAKAAIDNGPSGVIRYFEPQSTTFEKGMPVLLFWETTAGSIVTLNGEAVPQSGSKEVFPSQNTIYKLEARGVTSSSAEVMLVYLPPGTIKRFVAVPDLLDKDFGESSQLSWSTSIGSSVTLDGQPVEPNGSKFVTPNETTSYKLIATGNVVDTCEVTIAVMESDKLNRSFGRGVVASSAIDNSALLAVDGNLSTAWISQPSSAQWLYVDMGRKIEVNRVKLVWGQTYATTYHIQALTPVGSIMNLFSNGNGDGQTDDITGLKTETNIIRLICTAKNNTSSGYELKELEIYGKPVKPVDVEDDGDIIRELALLQNYPNPFNPTTEITYKISRSGIVVLKVYDLLGREAATLVNEYQTPGIYKARFDGTDARLASGIYFYTIRTGFFHQTKKMVLIR